MAEPNIQTRDAEGRAARKGPQTARRILEAALELFSRLGFERATLGEIAASAGVSQANLHYHFADKSELWRAAMLQLRAVIAEEERLLETTADIPPQDQLRMAMAVFLRVSWKHPALGRIVALEGMAGGERLEWLDAHLIGPRHRRLADLARAAVESGALKPFPAEILIVTLLTAGAGVINLSPLLQTSFGLDPSQPELRDAHEHLILDALMGGLLTMPSQEIP